VILKHALKNSLIPVLTLAGVNFVVMVNVAVVIEQIFAWPGIGDLVAVGISVRDFPMVQGVVLLAGVMVVMVNLVLDVLYAWLDPRIRLNR
jgi:peptide/nickel transport system permease protein